MRKGLRTTAVALLALLAAPAAPAQTARTLRADSSHGFSVFVAGPRDAAEGVVLVHVAAAEIHVYPGAAHAFAQPLFNRGTTYDPVATDVAWQLTDGFLRRAFSAASARRTRTSR